MNAQDAAEILANGGRITRVGWPEFLYLDPGDRIPDEDLSQTDFVELSEQDWERMQAEANGTLPETIQPQQTQVIQNPETFQAQPQPSNEQAGKRMTQINVKSKRDLKLSATYAGAPAELVLVTKITSSDTASVLPLNGDIPKVIGIKAAKNLSVTVDGIVKDAEGNAYEVSGISNLFDVIDADIAMMPALDPITNQPIMDTNEDGSPKLDPVTGSPIPKMIPAGALLSALVPEA
jgi:hypothetical protein